MYVSDFSLMDELDAKQQVTTTSSTKLLGIEGREIGGVTRKLLDSDLPLCSVADLTTESSLATTTADAASDRQRLHLTMQRTVRRIEEETRDEAQENDVEGVEHDHLHCLSAQVKTLLVRLMVPLLIIGILIVITFLESLIRGNTVNTEALLKVVKNELNNALDENGAANLLSSVNRTAQ